MRAISSAGSHRHIFRGSMHASGTRTREASRRVVEATLRVVLVAVVFSLAAGTPGRREMGDEGKQDGQGEGEEGVEAWVVLRVLRPLVQRLMRAKVIAAFHLERAASQGGAGSSRFSHQQQCIHGCVLADRSSRSVVRRKLEARTTGARVYSRVLAVMREEWDLGGEQGGEGGVVRQAGSACWAVDRHKPRYSGAPLLPPNPAYPTFVPASHTMPVGPSSPLDHAISPSIPALAVGWPHARSLCGHCALRLSSNNALQGWAVAATVAGVPPPPPRVPQQLLRVRGGREGTGGGDHGEEKWGREGTAVADGRAGGTRHGQRGREVGEAGSGVGEVRSGRLGGSMGESSCGNTGGAEVGACEGVGRGRGVWGTLGQNMGGSMSGSFIDTNMSGGGGIAGAGRQGHPGMEGVRRPQAGTGSIGSTRSTGSIGRRSASMDVSRRCWQSMPFSLTDASSSLGFPQHRQHGSAAVPTMVAAVAWWAAVWSAVTASAW
ncbi:unnamed protein product [Closterium sp. NIES-65]|nr:unnamed protein product [Closterium sp. NIES-65]